MIGDIIKSGKVTPNKLKTKPNINAMNGGNFNKSNILNPPFLPSATDFPIPYKIILFPKSYNAKYVIALIPHSISAKGYIKSPIFNPQKDNNITVLTFLSSIFNKLTNILPPKKVNKQPKKPIKIKYKSDNNTLDELIPINTVIGSVKFTINVDNISPVFLGNSFLNIYPIKTITTKLIRAVTLYTPINYYFLDNCYNYNIIVYDLIRIKLSFFV